MMIDVGTGEMPRDEFMVLRRLINDDALGRENQ